MHLAGDVGSLSLGSTPPSVDSPEVTFLTELGPRCGKLSALSFAAEGASLEAGLWMGTPLVGLRGDIPTGLRNLQLPTAETTPTCSFALPGSSVHAHLCKLLLK